MGGGASRWRRAAKRIGFPCGASFSNDIPPRTISSSAVSLKTEDEEGKPGEGGTGLKGAYDKRLCPICLEPLSCVDGSTDPASNQKIFTAQCMHVFHFQCIASNVRHGSVTCPICRAQWSQLPRELTIPSINNSDPILRILDDSIATSRFNRRSFLHTTHYNDDDPVEFEATTEAGNRRLRLTIIPALPRTALSPRQNTSPNRQKRAYLSVKLSYQQATDLVLVASPNGPHLRLLKQSMALVVFSLRPIDRLAIVTYSTTATRALPLRRMSSQGKRAALQVIDRIFYLGEAEPAEGLRKGLKILEDRAHHNPLANILHLSDSPTRSYVCRDLQFPIPIHRFHIGFGFGMSNGLAMHEFEEFLARLLGGTIRETQLRIGAEGGWISLGDLRGGEEKRIPLDLADDCGFLSVSYSYVEGGVEQRLSTGEVVVGTEKNDQNDGRQSEIGGSDPGISTGSSDSIQRWGYLDPFMARRWAKHLHGCKA
ncbi:probable E3 ubiquitin-protein ligase WAVH2 isoform X1 [Zingiber officinale]|uniref:probable E3 ubiquitin-protein ligase WAVH2 isoform X1 n=1 Tax=Zingiber officinale TaxID=94328 RepID=UPI001C4C8AA4|nr:probable E3 ubiquitin-protein ligase WAVH2 isoform X1 [Zingiber officinale]XP_042458088.1 probable E3 ubiquitin-protein ligase WAVH2 isoform X1 [Zingiber officinale]XP_042458089.1 probable E3 ubiquitin-protein ligase WAVH2 isoform X1 [Zingiber officinale]